MPMPGSSGRLDRPRASPPIPTRRASNTSPCPATWAAHPRVRTATPVPTTDVRTVLLAKDGLRPAPRVGMIVQTALDGREPRHESACLEATWNVIATVVPAP